MRVCIVGGGKVGFYLAKTLLEHGHEPVIVEENKSTCEAVANQLDIPVILVSGGTLKRFEGKARRVNDSRKLV